GARVAVVEMAGRLLSVEEPESSDLLARVFEREGIDVRTGASAAKVAHDGSEFTVTLADGAGLTAERLLVAAGRPMDLPSLVAAAVGLDDQARHIEADTRMRAAPGVWVVGDVAGKGAFTHLSMYHADIVIADILGRPVHEAEYHAVPRVTFTDPEIGS